MTRPPRVSLLGAVLAALLGLAAPHSSSAGAPQLPGRLWHSFSDLGHPGGTFTTNPNTGHSVRLQGQKHGVPWADGTRFVSVDYSSNGTSGESRFIVRSTADQRVLLDQVVDGDFNLITPAPAGANRILASWGENSYGPRSVVVWDFDARQLLFATPPSDTPDAFGWLPDGALLRVQRSGALSRVALGGAQTPLGSVSWPEARVPLNVFVSPDGTQALIQLVLLRPSGSMEGSDLWMLDLRGNRLRRFTNNGLIPYAVWSPDGRTVAFAKDTGYACSEASCVGSCTLWQADASAAHVRAREASGDARPFPLRRPDGSTTTLSCPLMAWTR